MSMRRYELLVRTAPGDLFEASVLGAADCVAEGRTREEAIAKARDSLVEKLAGGEIVTVDIESRCASQFSGFERVESRGRPAPR